MATNARPIGNLTKQAAAGIQSLRKEERMTQAELAEAADIPVETLSKIERGKAAIDLEQIERLASVFGMTPDAFLRAALKKTNVYDKKGRLNPDDTRGAEESADHIKRLDEGEDLPPPGRAS